MYTQNPVFIPGPTNMPEVLRRAVDVPTMDHRSSSFADILQPALAGVRQVIKSETAQIFLFPATGSGGWEAAITNLLNAGDRVLAARCGMFSHKWIDMCQRHGLQIDIVQSSWKRPLPLAEYEKRLRADKTHAIKAVLVTHNETATGVKSDVGGVRKLLNEINHPALLFVDGVSSIASMDFRMDEWQVDAAIAGSQKGFMLPVGLAILALSPKAIKALDSATLHRAFFDIKEMAKSYPSSGYPYTPSVGMLNGLKVATGLLLEEGLENVFSRHARIASGVRAAINAWGLRLYAEEEGSFSDTVSAVETPEGFDATAVVLHAARKYNVAFGAGLGDVAGRVFRIGHLGSLSDVTALCGIATAEMAMVDLGLPVQLGSGVAAAQEVYRSTHDAPVRKAA